MFVGKCCKASLLQQFEHFLIEFLKALHYQTASDSFFLKRGGKKTTKTPSLI